MIRSLVKKKDICNPQLVFFFKTKDTNETFCIIGFNKKIQIMVICILCLNKRYKYQLLVSCLNPRYKYQYLYRLFKPTIQVLVICILFKPTIQIQVICIVCSTHDTTTALFSLRLSSHKSSLKNLIQTNRQNPFSFGDPLTIHNPSLILSDEEPVAMAWNRHPTGGFRTLADLNHR